MQPVSATVAALGRDTREAHRVMTSVSMLWPRTGPSPKRTYSVKEDTRTGLRPAVSDKGAQKSEPTPKARVNVERPAVASSVETPNSRRNPG